ncbi:hypothetical protein PspCFBP13508_13330 [Pseudomonas sp. CFBP13508]|nr:hypothetical protein PspCFBP13508_13330 [Pseudomonas sp. CFBP13508]
MAGTADPVGASLLAKAVDQSTFMLNVSQHSRAGSLPQGLESAFSAVRSCLLLRCCRESTGQSSRPLQPVGGHTHWC